MVDKAQLIHDFEACLGWPYRSPGGTEADCSESGIDCSGMFVRAYRLQGEKIAHGSNTIWREHLSGKGKIVSEDDLAPGMAVFKWLDTGDRQQDGLGNFCHIGLVTGTHPLRIVHASTDGMVVRADSSLGQSRTGGFLWKYWGRLRKVAYDVTASVTPAGILRKGSRGTDVAQLQLLLRARGYDLAPDGIYGEMTRQAVMSFQAGAGLSRDGVVGPLTWRALGGI